MIAKQNFPADFWPEWNAFDSSHELRTDKKRKRQRKQMDDTTHDILQKHTVYAPSSRKVSPRGSLLCQTVLSGRDGRRALVSYTLFRTSRRSLALVVREHGELEVRVPLACSEAEIRRFLESRADWILTHMESQKKQSEEREALRPHRSEEEKMQLRKDCIQTMKTLLPERIAFYEPLLPPTHRPITRVAIRGQKTRWGSCSLRGSLSFNWKLALAPQECRDDVIDYVIVHELCHLVHMNHSAAFWSEVERILPDYQKARKWLKENGYTLEP